MGKQKCVTKIGMLLFGTTMNIKGGVLCANSLSTNDRLRHFGSRRLALQSFELVQGKALRSARTTFKHTTVLYESRTARNNLT